MQVSKIICQQGRVSTGLEIMISIITFSSMVNLLAISLNHRLPRRSSSYVDSELRLSSSISEISERCCNAFIETLGNAGKTAHYLLYQYWICRPDPLLQNCTETCAHLKDYIWHEASLGILHHKYRKLQRLNFYLALLLQVVRIYIQQVFVNGAHLQKIPLKAYI